MSQKWVEMWKKAGEAWCEILSQHKSQRTEEHHEKPVLITRQQLPSRLKADPLLDVFNYRSITIALSLSFNLMKSSPIRVMSCIRVGFRKARYLRKVGYRVASDMIDRAEMTRIRALKSLRLTLTASL
jgi:hypothetical protein